jgi:DNA topoisomerase-6 subunit B
VELGRLITLLHDNPNMTVAQFLTSTFSRVSGHVARKICNTAKISTRASTRRIGRKEADSLYQAIQATRIASPATDCISPIGEELILKGLHQVVPGEFYAAATRPPAVYRGNPFQIEVGIAYGGQAAMQYVTKDLLRDLIEESDARTIRQFLIHTFNGLGSEAADKIVKESGFGSRQSPAQLKPKEVEKLLTAMKDVNISEGQTMEVLRYANRVPLQFSPASCAITQTILGTNWRSYGLAQSRGGMPKGPVTVMVHVASVWVPFTSESKEAIASYPEIQKELRLALQAVGRHLGAYVKKRQKVKQQGERRQIFLRYLGEVATAVSEINAADRAQLYEQLLSVAKRRTADADMKLDDRGRRVEESDEAATHENVLIVDPTEAPAAINRAAVAEEPEPVEMPAAKKTSRNGDQSRRTRVKK